MAKDKQEEKETVADFKRVGKYHLVNGDKLDRAINGTVVSEGRVTGGAGPDAKPADVLAEYDRLGGLILKDGKYKVKTGSFYDFKKKAAVKKPSPVLVFVVNGETIEVDEDEPLPLEVRAAQQADERKNKKRKAAAKKTTKKGGKKAKDEDEEEEDEDDADEEGDDEKDADAEGEGEDA